MRGRSKAREQALQILYLIDVSGTSVDEALSAFESSFERDEDGFPFARQLVRRSIESRGEIDALIEAHSANWRLERMARIDRNVLRLATAELMECPETPTPVVLDEAIELGKRYGDAQTGSFVNGVLDQISKVVRKGV